MDGLISRPLGIGKGVGSETRGFAGSQVVSNTLMSVEAPGKQPEVLDEPLAGEEAKSFRSIAARLNYLCIDRPDIQYSVKEIARRMASPVRGDWRKLRKLGRYLIRRPRLCLPTTGSR